MKKGIETIKKVTGDVIELSLEAYKAKKSGGKITTPEYIGLIDEVIPVLSDISKANEFLAECKDLDITEGGELVVFIAGYGIIPDDAKKLAELIIDYFKHLIDGWKKFGIPIREEIKKLKG